MKKFISSKFFSSKFFGSRFRVQGLSVLSLLVQGLLVQSYGANWYLSTSGSGTGSGSWANVINYNSFNWNNVNAGDVVYLDGGATASSLTYSNLSGVSRNGTSGSRITITKDTANASHNGTVIIDAGGRTQGFVIDGNYVTVKHLKFTDATEGTSGFEVIRINGNYAYVMYNTIIFTVSKGIRADANVGSKILYNYIDTGAINDGGESDGIWLGNNGGGIEIRYNSIHMRNTVSGPHKDCIQTYGWQQSEATKDMTSVIDHNFFYSAGTGMIDNTILEGGGIGGHWYFTNNVCVFYRDDSGRALSVGLCSEAPYQDYPLYAHFYNNTIYVGGHGAYNPDYNGYEGGFAFQANFTDSLTFVNNIVRQTTDIIFQPVAIDENCRTGGNYLRCDYNKYVFKDASRFNFEYYNTSLGNCESPGTARNVSWTTWTTTYGQDTHSEMSTNDNLYDFVGSGFPYTGTQQPTADSSKYALEGSSAGIDEGTTVSFITDDYLGNPRPQNSIYDVGAFEFGSAPPAATKKVRVIIIQ